MSTPIEQLIVPRDCDLIITLHGHTPALVKTQLTRLGQLKKEQSRLIHVADLRLADFNVLQLEIDDMARGVSKDEIFLKGIPHVPTTPRPSTSLEDRASSTPPNTNQEQ